MNEALNTLIEMLNKLNEGGTIIVTGGRDIDTQLYITQKPVYPDAIAHVCRQIIDELETRGVIVSETVSETGYSSTVHYRAMTPAEAEAQRKREIAEEIEILESRLQQLQLSISKSGDTV